MEIKYKISLADLIHDERMLRQDIDSLVSWYVKNPVLLNLALDKNLLSGKAENPVEKKIKSGHNFIIALDKIINELDKVKKTASVSELGHLATKLATLISDNMSYISDKGKFPSVNDLIFSHYLRDTQHNRKIRDTQYQKASKLLERIHSLCIAILTKVKKMTGDPSIVIPERFEAARAALSVYDIVDFIRQHGDKYGISSKDDWGLTITNNQPLKEEITTIINALNRGHQPKDPTHVMSQIVPMLKAYQEKMQTNEFALETGKDIQQEQTRRELIKQRNDERFEKIKSLDPDPKFMAEQKGLEDQKMEDEKKKLEIEQDRERLIQKYEHVFEQWVKKG